MPFIQFDPQTKPGNPTAGVGSGLLLPAAMAEIQSTEFWTKCELMSKNSLRLSACEKFIAVPSGREFIVALNKTNGPDTASVIVKRMDW